jgi:hypothetical protein
MHGSHVKPLSDSSFVKIGCQQEAKKIALKVISEKV